MGGITVLASTCLRNRVLAEVRARVPLDGRERASIARFIAEFVILDEPFSEQASDVHVTGSGLVVSRLGVVLHRHRLLHVWVPPGGHIDPGETPADAALRETTEETGLSVAHPDGGPRLVLVDVHAGPRGHTHLDLLYLLDGVADAPAPPPDESQEVAWFTWPDAQEIAEPYLAGILRWGGGGGNVVDA